MLFERMLGTRHIHSSGLTVAYMTPKLLDKVSHSVSISGQRANSGFFIITHESAIAFDVGAEDSGEFTLKTFLGHFPPFFLGFKTDKALRNKLYQRNPKSDER